MVYKFGHIILYRPFLHYLAKRGSDVPPDERQLRCALECIKISQSTINDTTVMLQQGFICSASWHPIYTTFLAVVSLTFFLATQSDSLESIEIRQTTESGIRILANTSCQDSGAKRCLDVVRVSRTPVLIECVD
jgi:hypothetical protein